GGAHGRRRAAPRGGDGEGPHQGPAAHRVCRGTRPGGCARQRAPQGAHERLPRARAHVARGLPRPRTRRERRDGGGRARVDRYLQRRTRMDHGGRLREHHRGLVGGPHRLVPLRDVAPTGAGGSVTTIRAAVVDDARAIAEVHVGSWRSTYRGQLPDDLLDRLSVDEREAQWSSGLTDPKPWAGAL